MKKKRRKLKRVFDRVEGGRPGPGVPLGSRVKFRFVDSLELCSGDVEDIVKQNLG